MCEYFCSVEPVLLGPERGRKQPEEAFVCGEVHSTAQEEHSAPPPAFCDGKRQLEICPRAGGWGHQTLQGGHQAG